MGPGCPLSHEPRLDLDDFRRRCARRLLAKWGGPVQARGAMMAVFLFILVVGVSVVSAGFAIFSSGRRVAPL